ncbi:MAG: biopolymer transporter ExbD [Bacteroidota bacterium]
MSKRAEVPKVNAGSMADIAFLLLIFFLVTTSIETDVGIDRLLPPMDTGAIADVRERNLLRIQIDGANRLLVEESLVKIEELRAIAIAFLDNGGAERGTEEYCNYCKGAGVTNSSDNPDKAVISLTSNRETHYGAYIAVQNELVGAYNQLRNREAQRLFQQDYTAMVAEYDRPETSLVVKERLKKSITHIQGMFPQKIAEVKVE